jgi:Uroporphyrinogen decarboxylase (URO-D)
VTPAGAGDSSNRSMRPPGVRPTIRTVWLRARRYVGAVFRGQCEIALANLERIAARLGDLVDVVNICGTDFGTQTSSFCGAVKKFVPSFLEAGFDILNPVQCSAAGMEAETLKQKYGRELVFWGGGVDTQQVLPFGTPEEVREQVLGRCEAFYKDGGFVFNAVHSIQARTPVENIVAMIRAVESFNGGRAG